MQKITRITAIIVTAVLALSLTACRQASQSQSVTENTPPYVTESLQPSAPESTPPVVTESTPPTAAENTPPPTAPESTPPDNGEFTFTTENMPVIDGSTATIPLIEAVYSVLLGIPREQAADMVSTSGTDNAYYRLFYGGADILLVYSPSPDTLENAKNTGIELEMAPIGCDGLVFLVNKANPVSSLTPDQLVSIYSGETRNWKEVGGEDVDIKAFQRPYLSGSQTMMNELVMKGVPMAETEAEYVIGEMGGLIEAVAQFDNAQSAIGYNVYYFVSRMDLNENVRMLAVDGVEPSTQSISDGSYPFVSDFYAVIRKDTPEGSPARVLYDWIQSPDGINLIQHEGYSHPKAR